MIPKATLLFGFLGATAALATVRVQDRAKAQAAIEAARSRGPILAISNGSLPDSHSGRAGSIPAGRSVRFSGVCCKGSEPGC